MKKSIFLLFIIFTCVACKQESVVAKKETDSFNQNQTKQIQQIAHDYIVNNPSILLEAGKKLQEQEVEKEKAKIEKIKENIAKYKKETFDAKAPGRIVTGNPDGKLILAEFTQHQCPHCKTIKPLIADLLKNNPELQHITIYWPFFGNDAVYAAKAAVAAQNQNKFDELNQAMLAVEEFMTQEKIDEIIKSIPGLDAKKLKTDMGAKELDNGIKANLKLAQDLDIIGTPTFIFTNSEMTKFSLIPGQVPNIEEELKISLDKVR